MTPDICPACEKPSIGKCPERSDGVHPSWEEYNVEMAEVPLTERVRRMAGRRGHAEVPTADLPSP